MKNLKQRILEKRYGENLKEVRGSDEFKEYQNFLKKFKRRNIFLCHKSYTLKQIRNLIVKYGYADKYETKDELEKLTQEAVKLCSFFSEGINFMETTDRNGVRRYKIVNAREHDF